MLLLLLLFYGCGSSVFISVICCGCCCCFVVYTATAAVLVSLSPRSCGPSLLHLLLYMTDVVCCYTCCNQLLQSAVMVQLSSCWCPVLGTIGLDWFAFWLEVSEMYDEALVYWSSCFYLPYFLPILFATNNASCYCLWWQLATHVLLWPFALLCSLGQLHLFPFTAAFFCCFA